MWRDVKFKRKIVWFDLIVILLYVSVVPDIKSDFIKEEHYENYNVSWKHEIGNKAKK